MNHYRLHRFGSNPRIYYFPPATSFTHNFMNLVPRTVRLPGTSGGFDEFLGGVAPSEIGKVQAMWYVIPKENESITTLLDTLGMISDWGEQKLYILPWDTTYRERWCYARINDISISENAKDHPEKWQRVSATWQVADPYWYNLGTEAALWGDVQWANFTWGGSANPQLCSGQQTDFTITVGGNAITLARITITVPAAKTAEDVTVQRLESTTIRDQIRRTGILTPADSLSINARTHTIQLNGLDAYTTAFTFHHQDWFRLLPGTNSIRVLLKNASDEANVKIQWYERYRSS
jgi:hypothetical protein